MQTVDFIHDDLSHWKEFESQFPEGLKTYLDTYNSLKELGATIVTMVEDGKAIGRFVYVDLDLVQPALKGTGLDQYFNRNAAYVWKNVVLPEYQGKGYGVLMTEHRLQLMRADKYRYSVGHARANGSIKQAQKVGAKVEGKMQNWQGTGEDVFVCVLDLG